MWHKFFSVTSISEATELLEQYGSQARIIAGGTDLILEIERGARAGVDVLIDVTRIANLDTTEAHEDQLHLGPLVTHNQTVASPLVQAHAFPLAQAAWEVGAPPIRNRATIAGNVITASPANDTITPLLAMNAEVALASKREERIVPLREFYTGYRQIDLRPDEMLTAIRIPVMGPDSAGTFMKLGLRRAQAIAVINVAVVLTFEDAANRNSNIVSAAVAVGCVAPTVIRLQDVETFLQGRQLSKETINEAARLAASTVKPIDDVRSTAEYRIEMVRVYMARALRQLRDGQERTGFPNQPSMLWGSESGRVKATLPHTTHHEHGQAKPITTTINGKKFSVANGTNKTLLRFIREDIGLIGTKEGCAEGECGACTVYLDGSAVMSCMVPAPRAHDAEIVTVEGLADQNGNLHPLQERFIDAGAVQCGYCTPGFLMSGAKLLEEHPQPTRTQIEQALSGNLCRCTGYYKIIEAFNLNSS